MNSCTLETQVGVSQISVPGPLLILVCIIDLHSHLTNQKFSSSLFADDTSLTCTDKFSLPENVSNKLDTITKSLNYNRIIPYVKKSIVLKYKRKLTETPVEIRKEKKLSQIVLVIL